MPVLFVTKYGKSEGIALLNKHPSHQCTELGHRNCTTAYRQLCKSLLRKERLTDRRKEKKENNLFAA